MTHRIKKYVSIIRFILKGTNSVSWFDRMRIVIRINAPGLAGAGLGLPIDEGQWGALKSPGLRGSCLAYCLKKRRKGDEARSSGE